MDTLSRLTALHVLVVIGLLEVAINRIAVPMLRPDSGLPPSWHTVLDYSGLFLFYFTGVLAALVIAQRCVQVFTSRSGPRELISHGIAVATTLLASVPLVIAAPGELSLVLEVTFAVAVIALIATAVGKNRDLGIQIGLPLIAIPLLIHTANVVGARFIWPDSTFDGPGLAIARAGVVALCIAALLSPYCFAPRPFARAVTRPGPVIAAMAIASVGAILARFFYPSVAKAASLAIGVEMSQGSADPRLALYLLAVATLAWTLASSAFSPSEARRRVGTGLALLLVGGYGFRWPHHYLLPLLGLMLISDAVRRVREEELADMPLASETPPILDTTWQTYIASVTQALRDRLGEVHSLTTRGDGGLMSSVIVGEANGTTVRARIERIDGCVLALDVVVGREIDELRGSTLTLWSIPTRQLGANPPGPPAAPMFKTGDSAFDERFKTRGSALALTRLLDTELRSRVLTTLDGWLAYWEHESLRYRVYPGRGAPMDHPIPISDLAIGRSATQVDRIVAVIELLVEIAARGVKAAPVVEPSELEVS